MKEFEKELESLINIHSLEADSGTPDFILSKLLVNVLNAFNDAVKDREEWHGRKIRELAE